MTDIWVEREAPEKSEIMLVTMRCLLKALERDDSDLVKMLAGVVERILNPPIMQQPVQEYCVSRQGDYTGLDYRSGAQ